MVRGIRRGEIVRARVSVSISGFGFVALYRMVCLCVCVCVCVWVCVCESKGLNVKCHTLQTVIDKESIMETYKIQILS